MQFARKKIEQRLNKLPRNSVVFFAHRCAIRALPFLSVKKDFSYWEKQDRKKHLIALIRCLDFHHYGASYAASAAYAAAYAASDVAYAASAAAYASDAASAAYAASDAAYAADAAADAAYAYAADYTTAKEAKKISEQILSDLTILESKQTKLEPIKQTHWDKRFTESLEAIGMDYWADVYRQYLTGAINEAAAQRRRKLPQEILESGYDAITAYLMAAEQGEEQKFHEVKAVFLGDGGAGKTSLVTKIIDRNAPLPTEEERTAGVQVMEHTIPDSDHKIRIWDFGGQVVYHAAHQLFMTERTLYVVVLDNRRENEPDYWLKHAEVFGGNSPVLVVINKWDQHQDGIAEKTLKKTFPNIVGFYHVACTKPDVFDFDQFLQDFYQTCKENKNWERSFPQQWLEVKTTLEKFQQPFITHEAYQQICQENDITDEKQRDSLLVILKNLGIVLYYPELGLDNQVLDPEWLSGAIYKIITSDILEQQKGEVRLEQLQKILQDKKVYPKSQHLFILKVAAKFELCYFVNASSALFPDRFPVDEPQNTDLPENYSPVLFRYDFDFLPRVVFPRFLSKMYGSLKELKAWRTGAIMTQGRFGNVARVTVNYTNKTIDVEIAGSEPRDFFREILPKMDDIFETFERFQVTELVPVGIDQQGERMLDNYRELAKLTEKGETTRTYGSLPEAVNIEILLAQIETREARQERLFMAGMDAVKEGLKAAGNAGLKNQSMVSNINVPVNMANNINVTINVDIKNQSLGWVGQHLDMLIEDMKDAGETDEALNKRLARMKNALTELEKETDPKKAASSSATLRLKGLYDDFVNQGSRLNKALNKLDNGWKTASEIARHYNTIAEWSLGALPQIPETLLKRK